LPSLYVSNKKNQKFDWGVCLKKVRTLKYLPKQPKCIWRNKPVRSSETYSLTQVRLWFKTAIRRTILESTTFQNLDFNDLKMISRYKHYLRRNSPSSPLLKVLGMTTYSPSGRFTLRLISRRFINCSDLAICWNTFIFLLSGKFRKYWASEAQKNLENLKFNKIYYKLKAKSKL